MGLTGNGMMSLNLSEIFQKVFQDLSISGFTAVRQRQHHLATLESGLKGMVVSQQESLMGEQLPLLDWTPPPGQEPPYLWAERSGN